MDETSSWQREMKSPFDRFSYVAETGKFSDLTISSISGTRYQVHQIVFATHSKVFDKMFYGSMDYDPVMEFALDTDDETVEWLINFMYRNNALMNTVENALQLYCFSHQWQMDLLLARCTKYLEIKVNEYNARTILEFTCIYPDKPLTDCCLSFLGKLQQKMIFEQSIGYSREAFIKIINYRGNYCGESQIFKSSCKWAEHRLIKNNEEVDGISLRRELGDILFQIRYLVMTPKEFVSNVLSTNVLTDHESVSILLRLTNSNAPLPECISDQQNRKQHSDEKIFIHSISLFKKSSCNWKTLFNHWNVQHSEQMMVFSCSENILIRCIRMKSECFPGAWNLVIKTEKGAAVSVSNDCGPPWYFTNAVLVCGIKYFISIFGRGGKYTHPTTSFDLNSNFTFFNGECCKCCVVVEYCVC